MIEQFTKISQ